MAHAISNSNLHLRVLSEGTEGVVVNLVAGYVHPKDGCTDQMKWLAYRIWNAIKAIFGMSDWQQAITIVKGEILEAFGRPVDRGSDSTHGAGVNIVNEIFARLNGAPAGHLPEPSPIVPPHILPSSFVNLSPPLGLERDSIQRMIADTPKFNSYEIRWELPYEAAPLSGMSLRPSNLFFKALGAEVTMPGEGELFSFINPGKVRADIMNADPNSFVEFSARGLSGSMRFPITREGEGLVQIPDLSAIYGHNTYRISYKELQDTLKSQKIFCSSWFPKPFYQALKKALLQDHIVLLPGQDGPPVLMKDLRTPHCQACIAQARENPRLYGFRNRAQLGVLLNWSMYQLGAMIVKTEDFRIFADGDGQILERNPGEPDAIRLINACGIRGIRAHGAGNDDLHQRILKETFSTALQAAEDGFIVFPAVGMGVWNGDPSIYWTALFDAVGRAGTGLEKIFINPRHARSIDGKYRGRSGDECAEILNDCMASYESQGDAVAVANLRKIVNLYDEKTDLLQLSYKLKKAYPLKTISLVNASDPDVTLGNHTTEYSNNRPHCANTTEEHYSMLGTNGLCFECITGVHEEEDRIVQAL